MHHLPSIPEVNKITPPWRAVETAAPNDLERPKRPRAMPSHPRYVEANLPTLVPVEAMLGKAGQCWDVVASTIAIKAVLHPHPTKI